ncbi:MAG: VOC family protein [Roseiflexaceae bacterium]
MLRSIDHIVILVGDLDAASADYAALGFTVTPGGEHTGGETHNALVAFADDTYLELIAFKRTAPGHRWWRHGAAGGGLVDFALLPGAIEQDIAAARERGVAYTGPVAGGRLRLDGQQVSWQLGMPPSADLPFLCGDVTPRALRVPTGAARQHPNGVSGIAGLTVAVADLDASAARYRALLGGDQAGPLFTLGAATIELAGPDSGGVRERLAARGEGIHALALRVDAAANAGPLDLGRTHGALIELVADEGVKG